MVKRLDRRSTALLIAVLALASVAALLGATLFGSVRFGPDEWRQGLLDMVRGGEGMATTLLRLRLERAATAFITGACLGLSGALMQILLRNPLAEPYILGLSGGAGAGALLLMLLGASAWMIDAGAFAGAVAAIALVIGFTRGPRRADADPGERGARVLLTGAVLTAGWGALITLLLVLAPDGQQRNMLFWLMGDLSGAAWRPWTALILLAVLFLTWRRARALNVMALGSAAAATLGVSTSGIRRLLFLASSCLAGVAVTSAGSIGFVGLILPHACRLLIGHDHRALLPAVTLSGGIFLTLADTLARTVAAPQQLPVGLVTALIGVPVFLVLLLRERGR